MRKNKLQIALTALFGVLAFCFWAFVRPELLMERESFQLFLFNSDYLTERLSVPGGFSRYVGEFLTQFFMSEKTGACILALLLMAIQWLSWILLHRCLPAVAEKLLFLISFLPAMKLCYACRCLADIAADGTPAFGEYKEPVSITYNDPLWLLAGRTSGAAPSNLSVAFLA